MIVDIQELARRMLAAYDARTPGQCLALPLNLTIAQAYDVQAEVARLREDRGEKIIGYKVGCTSRLIQEQLGIKEPIFGRLFDTECHDSGARISHTSYANLAVEGELAIRLATDLPASKLDRFERLDTIESIFPVIELHNYVLRSPKTRVQELIASNGMHAGFVLAEQPHGGPLGDDPADLTVRVDGERVGVSDGPWTMSDPMAALRWLAARLGKYGLGLSRGQVILTGSPLPLYLVGPGSRVVVETPPLGKCRVTVNQ